MKAFIGISPLFALLSVTPLLASPAAAQTPRTAPVDRPPVFGFAIPPECGTPGASAPHTTSRGQECVREPLQIPPTDISDVYVGEGATNYGVVVIFASAAAERILRFSGQNVGNR